MAGHAAGRDPGGPPCPLTPRACTRPAGPRPGVGIVHLGLGAFFRAHGAIYVAEAMAKSGGDWGIVGVSLVRPDQRDLLAPQGFAYTALELGPDGETPRVIDVVQDVLVARENPGGRPRRHGRPGRPHRQPHRHREGLLPRALDRPAQPRPPRHRPRPRPSRRAALRAGLPRRAPSPAAAPPALRPFTVLCCDNLPENGRVVRGVTLELARLHRPRASPTGSRPRAAFPSTMVDRIVPATKPEDIERLAALTGVLDLSPVMHEPFRQWVVEDDFVDGARPDLGAVGVQLVEDVTPFELMKLRMLNGTHSSLAYLGYLAGHETIADTVDDPAFAGFVPPPLARRDHPDASRRRRARISPPTPTPSSPATPTRRSATAPGRSPWTARQKLPQRILGTIADNRAAGRPCPGLTLAVAAWMHYVGGVDERGAADRRPRPARRAPQGAVATRRPTRPTGSPRSSGSREVFPPALAADRGFRDDLAAAAGRWRPRAPAPPSPASAA